QGRSRAQLRNAAALVRDPGTRLPALDRSEVQCDFQRSIVPVERRKANCDPGGTLRIDPPILQVELFPAFCWTSGDVDGRADGAGSGSAIPHRMSVDSFLMRADQAVLTNSAPVPERAGHLHALLQAPRPRGARETCEKWCPHCTPGKGYNIYP